MDYTVRRRLGFSLLEPCVALMVLSLFSTVIWLGWSHNVYYQHTVAQKSHVLQWAQAHLTEQSLLFFQGQALSSASGHWQAGQNHTVYWQQTITERAEQGVELGLNIHWQTERGQTHQLDIQTGFHHFAEDTAPLNWMESQSSD